MFTAGVGISDAADAREGVTSALRQAKTQMGRERADLVLCFATVDHAPCFAEMHAVLVQGAGTDHVVGCSGGGVIGGRREIEGAPGVAVLTVATDEMRMALFHDPDFHRDNRASAERIAAAVDTCMGDNPLLIAFPDPLSMQGDRFLEAIEDYCGRVPIVGGAAGDDGRHGHTYQIGPQGVTTHGVSGVLLSGPIRHSAGITQACHPLCTPEVITAGDGNRIDEIGGRPAVALLAELLKEQGILQFSAAAGLIFLAIPLDPTDAKLQPGHYTARNLTALDLDNGAVYVGEEIQVGQAVAFAIREPARALRDMQAMVRGVAEAWPAPPPTFGLYTNCCGRGRGLYRRANRDAAIIGGTFDHVPVAGFFSYAEFCPVERHNRLHNYSGILTLVGEALA
jgi:small ligand-binding sensory domain FIST